MNSKDEKEWKVTIAVAVYNTEAYVEQCARSLFEQTLEEIDFLFVDDGSTDDSVAIVERTLKDYPNRAEQVRFIRYRQNQGLACVRREACEAARGEYLVYVDSDDYVEPNYAELLYAKAKETGADVVACDYFIHQEGHETYRVRKLSPLGEGENGSLLREGTINTTLDPNVWCRLVRKDLLLENEILWPRANNSEDKLISIQTAYYARRMAYVQQPLYHYRYNTASLSRNKDKAVKLKVVDELLTNYRIMEEFIAKHHIMEQYPDCTFYSKLNIRNRLLPFWGERKYRRRYLRTFPEMNRIYLFGNKYHRPSWRERVWILALMLGLYPLMGKLLHKYCRPYSAWYRNPAISRNI